MQDHHTRHFHEQQAELLTRFRAVQRTLLEGYERAAAAARIDTQDENPILANYAAIRLAWNTQAAAELRGRMNDAE